MSLTLEDLEEWDDKIRELVDKFGLNCYPQEFEICDHFEMIGYMAYSGMPSRYPHWSFGKSYEKQKTLYDYGAGGLPYEMVINSNPCLAYLMRDNTDLLQILTIAHVYGHNDFFANNFYFVNGVPAEYVISMFKNHGLRVRSYMEDPSIGVSAVEDILDATHAINLQRTSNSGITKLSQAEIAANRLQDAQPTYDEYANIHPKKDYEAPVLDKIPLEPTPNILEFVAEYSRGIDSWQRDLIQIVDRESAYFIPQIETKIMNEGWASYWHHKILNELNLPQKYHLEFLVRHNQVLRPTPGGLNPYHLGFIMFHDIERRWNEGDTGREFSSDKPREDISSMEENDTPGRKKIFDVRTSDRDTSFLRRFLTPEIMRELDIFQHEKRGKERVITKVADEESWNDVKETLIKSIGVNSIPKILVDDANFGKKGTLYLTHEHDGRDLQLEFAEKTIKHIETLWCNEVVLETQLNGKKSLLKLEGQSLKVTRL